MVNFVFLMVLLRGCMLNMSEYNFLGFKPSKLRCKSDFCFLYLIRVISYVWFPSSLCTYLLIACLVIVLTLPLIWRKNEESVPKVTNDQSTIGIKWLKCLLWTMHTKCNILMLQAKLSNWKLNKNMWMKNTTPLLLFCHLIFFWIF